MGLRVFVGYGGAVARAVAIRLVDFLKENKIEAYMAPKDNPPGEWDPIVQGALRQADVFVPVCSPQSFRSKEFYKEIVLATEWNIKFESLVDARVNRLGPHFPQKMRTSDCVEFENTIPDASFNKVLEKLSTLIGGLPYRFIEPVEAVPA